MLGVDKGAKDDDLNNAHRNFAKVLSDQHGEEGTKGQVLAGGGSTFFSSGGGDGPASFRFDTRNMIYSGGTRSGVREGAAKNSGQQRKPPPVIERWLPCSLEDLYKGATKKMKISREILDGSGRTTTVEETLAINIQPGSDKGTKMTLTVEGSAAPSIAPADAVFIANEKPQDVFTREGNDLVATKKITLVEALTSYTACLTTLDGRSLTLPIDNVIHPGYEEVVLREGMQVPRDSSERGNLLIRFDVKFPARLTAEQKDGIKKILDSVD